MTSTLASRLALLTLLLSLIALAFALYSQHVLGMRPCAWCVLQRLILALVAACSALSLWALQSKNRMYPRLSLLLNTALSLSGIAAAWYQYTVAAQLFSCDMTLADQIMTQSGLEAGLPWLFGIYATCMDARVDLFGIEYALWGLVLFLVSSILSLIALVSLRKA